jgi:hypothetical protein
MIPPTPIYTKHLTNYHYNTIILKTHRTPLYGIMDRAHARSVAIDRRARAWLLPALWAVCLGVAAVLPAGNPVSFRSLTGIGALPDLSPGFYPEGLLAHLDARGGTHRTFNYFNWGGAFIHRLYPKERVFIDQRNDCYPMEVFSDYFAVHNLERDWRRVLDRWQIDSVAYPPGEELAKALEQEPGWVVAYRDDRSMLFERRPTGGQPP